MNYIQRIYDLLTEAQINEGMQRDIRKMKGLQKAKERADKLGLRAVSVQKGMELEGKIDAATGRTERASKRSSDRMEKSVGGTHAQRKIFKAPKGGFKDTEQNMDKRHTALRAANQKLYNLK